jgi:hypothetical protein
VFDATFVEAITKLAKRAENPVVDMPEDSARYYGLRQPDGSVKIHYLDRPARNHYLESLASLATFVNTEALHADYPLTVWINMAGVQVSLKPLDQQSYMDFDDSASLSFVQTREFSAIVAERMHNLTHDGFVQHLRTTFRRALNREPNLLAQLSHLRQTKAGEITSTVLPGKESMGRSLSTDVGAQDNTTLPETVMLELRPFENHDTEWREGVECVLEVDPENFTFALTPLVGEIARLQHSVLTEIHNLLEAAITAPETVLLFGVSGISGN